MNITGNTILITGSASGIGRALAEALHAQGKAYLSRWQVKLAFKMMKSILCFGHLPKKETASLRFVAR